MSFISGPNSELQLEAERAREQELEARAERYAETHPDRGESGSPRGLFRRLIDLFRGTRR